MSAVGAHSIEAVYGLERDERGCLSVPSRHSLICSMLMTGTMTSAADCKMAILRAASESDSDSFNPPGPLLGSCRRTVPSWRPERHAEASYPFCGDVFGSLEDANVAADNLVSIGRSSTASRRDIIEESIAQLLTAI